MSKFVSESELYSYDKPSYYDGLKQRYYKIFDKQMKCNKFNKTCAQTKISCIFDEGYNLKHSDNTYSTKDSLLKTDNISNTLIGSSNILEDEPTKTSNDEDGGLDEENDEDHEYNEDDLDEEDENMKSSSSKFSKDRKKRFKIKKLNEKTIFEKLSCRLVDDDETLYNEKYMYGINTGELIYNIKTEGEVFINFPGGFVPRLGNEKFFNEHYTIDLSKTLDLDPINYSDNLQQNALSVVDFNSLYPSAIKWRNMCFSSLLIHRNYPTRGPNNNELVDPNDSKLFYKLIIPIKINANFIYVQIYFAKHFWKKSAFYEFIDRNFSERNRYKKLAKEYQKNPLMYSQYLVCDFMQNTCKLLSNSAYGTMTQPYKNSMFNFLIGSAVTYIGRSSLLKCFLYLMKKCSQDTNLYFEKVLNTVWNTNKFSNNSKLIEHVKLLTTGLKSFYRKLNKNGDDSGGNEVVGDFSSIVSLFKKEDNFMELCIPKIKDFLIEITDANSLEFISENLLNKFNHKSIEKMIAFFENLDDYFEGKTKRRMIYGDTDSIFFCSPNTEMNYLTENFNKQEINANILKIELEKSMNVCLLLSRKNYIMYFNNKIVTKGIISRKQTVPGRTFLYHFIELMISEKFDVSKIRISIQNLFLKFKNSNKNLFVQTQKLSKNPSEYKNKDVKIVQIEELSKVKKIQKAKGDIVSLIYTTYILPYQFEILKSSNKVDKNELKQKLVGPIDYTDELTIKFLNQNKLCTIILEELFDQYSNSDEFQVDVVRFFESDLKAALKKIFETVNCQDFIDMFEEEFYKSFGVEFLKIEKELKNIKQRARLNKKPKAIKVSSPRKKKIKLDEVEPQKVTTTTTNSKDIRSFFKIENTFTNKRKIQDIVNDEESFTVKQSAKAIKRINNIFTKPTSSKK